MTKDGWRELVLRAAHDPHLLRILAQLLHEQDVAKELLHRKGYGVSGTPWLDIVAAIPSRT